MLFLSGRKLFQYDELSSDDWIFNLFICNFYLYTMYILLYCIRSFCFETFITLENMLFLSDRKLFQYDELSSDDWIFNPFIYNFYLYTMYILLYCIRSFCFETFITLENKFSTSHCFGLRKIHQMLATNSRPHGC